MTVNILIISPITFTKNIYAYVFVKKNTKGKGTSFVHNFFSHGSSNNGRGGGGGKPAKIKDTISVISLYGKFQIVSEMKNV